MSAETLQYAWEWLLSLSKLQLILLGGAISLLVAVSKVIRFLFLLGRCSRCAAASITTSSIA